MGVIDVNCIYSDAGYRSSSFRHKRIYDLSKKLTKYTQDDFGASGNVQFLGCHKND
jgi:hypothetical protein